MRKKFYSKERFEDKNLTNVLKCNIWIFQHQYLRCGNRILLPMHTILHLFAYLLDWTDRGLIGDIPFRFSTKMSLHNECKCSHILSANISVPYIMMPVLSNKMFCWMFLSPLVELIALSPSIRLPFKLQSVSDQWKCMKWPSVNTQASVLGCVLCNAVCVAGFWGQWGMKQSVLHHGPSVCYMGYQWVLSLRDWTLRPWQIVSACAGHPDIINHHVHSSLTTWPYILCKGL